MGTVGAAAASGVGAAGTKGADTGDGVVAGGCCFFFSASWNITVLDVEITKNLHEHTQPISIYEFTPTKLVYIM